jgi:hypothetical protein
MSGTYSATRYVAEAQRLRREYSQTLDRLNQVNQESVGQLAGLTERTATALAELVAALLPDLSPQSLQRAVQLTGYLPLLQNDPAPRMAQVKQQLELRLAEIENDRRYRDRLLLRAPRVGMLVRDVAELEEFRAPLADLCQKCQHPRLSRLLESGYGTPKYDIGFWRVSYYQDWKAGDEILSRFPAGKSFAELRSEYNSACETIAVYDGKLSKLRDEIRASEALEQEYNDKQQQIRELPETFLRQAREQLSAYLRDLDLISIGDRLSFDPQLEGLAKRYFGLRKQQEYLRETQKHFIQNSRASIEQSIKAMDREIAKYERPKYAYSALPTSRFDRLQQWQQRNQRYQGQLERYNDTQHVIVSFNHYDYGRLDEDFLWWDLITRGRLSGQYIDEVSHFHVRHPRYHYEVPPELRHDDEYLRRAEARAAAANARARDRRERDRDIS